MTQNAPKTNASPGAQHARPILARIAAALAGGTCLFALAIPLTGQSALAEGWQVTTRHFPGGWTESYTPFDPDGGRVSRLKDGPAPGNNCRFSAFEIVNPRRGETRCVGYVPPAW